MKNRTRIDILAEMIRAAKEGTRKTRIMHLAFISPNQVDEYMNALLDSGLLVLLDGPFYQTTAKGLRYLELYEELEESLLPINAASGQPASQTKAVLESSEPKLQTSTGT